jgi:hypothetical protein
MTVNTSFSYVLPPMFAVLVLVAFVVSPIASVARATTLDTPSETVAQLVVPVDVVTYEPCEDEPVELKGTLSFQGSLVSSEGGEVELQYALQATDVHGSGLETGARYDFVGESQGSVRHLDRLVSADDFQAIARREPGVEVARASVGPRYRVAFAVTLSEKGAIETVVPTSVFTDEKCP